MAQFWKGFCSDESGQGLTEYALIIGLVSVALILLLTAMAGSLGTVFNAIVDELQNIDIGTQQKVKCCD